MDNVDLSHISFVALTENSFARIRRSFGTDGEKWNVTVQIFDSELEDMSEARMVEFTAKPADIAASLATLIEHIELKKNEKPDQDPDADNR